SGPRSGAGPAKATFVRRRGPTIGRAGDKESDEVAVDLAIAENHDIPNELSERFVLRDRVFRRRTRMEGALLPARSSPRLSVARPRSLMPLLPSGARRLLLNDRSLAALARRVLLLTRTTRA